MQITLNENEITAAVEAYVHTQINVAEDQELTIEFTAGRGANGLTATLDIAAAGSKKKKAAATRTAPKQTKPVPEKDPEPVATEEPQEEADEEEAPAISFSIEPIEKGLRWINCFDH